jgi:uncharacterized protein (TIGR00369 family)
MEKVEKRAKELAEVFSRAPLKKSLNIELSFGKDGEAILRMPHNPDFENALGDTHGGIIAALLDSVGWFAAAVHYDGWIATVEMQVRFLEPAGREDLTAKGHMVRAGKTFAVAEMEVRTVSGRLVATGSGTFAATSVKI